MRKNITYDFYNPEQATKISEAIIKRVADSEVEDEKHIYDITFPESHKCSGGGRMVVGGVVCIDCYGRALGEKMRELASEQHRPFLEYQISLHRNPKKWLKELSQFVADFESAFEMKDFGIVPQWEALLDEYLNDKSPIHSITQYQLPENFKLKAQNIKAEKIDIAQTAILFHLLREAKVFINYSNADLAKFAHYLTGHSEQNLRTEKGFSNIHDIMLKERNRQKAYNLQALRKVLLDIIDNIDSLSN